MWQEYWSDFTPFQKWRFALLLFHEMINFYKNILFKKKNKKHKVKDLIILFDQSCHKREKRPISNTTTILFLSKVSRGRPSVIPTYDISDGLFKRSDCSLTEKRFPTFGNFYPNFRRQFQRKKKCKKKRRNLVHRKCAKVGRHWNSKSWKK